MSIGVVITSYGDSGEWADRRHRAIESVRGQCYEGAVWRSLHWKDPEGMSLGAMRNSAALQVIEDYEDVDRLIFLDADDELAPGYLKAMGATTEQIVQPATLGIRPDGVEDEKPIMLKEKPLIDGNYIVIGACIDAALFQEVGGFGDQPIYEDWDLWLRMYNAGATVGKCPQAVYRVHVNENGRNSDVSLQKKWYDSIRRANMSAYNLRSNP